MRLYRLLLKLYPARFREEFDGPLERQFRDDYRDARTGWARFVFWTRTLIDLAVSIPVEFLREIRQDVSYSARVYARRPLSAAAGLILAATAAAATWTATHRVARMDPIVVLRAE